MGKQKEIVKHTKEVDVFLCPVCKGEHSKINNAKSCLRSCENSKKCKKKGHVLVYDIDFDGELTVDCNLCNENIETIQLDNIDNSLVKKIYELIIKEA